MKLKKMFSQNSTVNLFNQVILILLITGVFQLTVNGQAPNVTYKAPIVITQGGTYSGNWESKSSNTPAIMINTDQPVIIQNSIIKSAGDLIYSASRNCNVTIRNTKGYGVTPTVDNKPKGRFLLAYAFKKAIVENNYMENTSGIYLDNFVGTTTATETIRVRYNKAKNIDGRYRNGGRAFVQFCVLNNIRRVSNIEIAWNEVINRPKESAVEDNINMHFSSGTSTSPIKIHDNYIQGSYPLNLSSTSHSGGGIMLADGASGTASTVSSYVRAYNNHVVSTANHGLAIAGGNNNLIYNNRVISCGYVKVGTSNVYIAAQNVGIYILNVTKTSSSVFYNNTAKDNTVGWVNKITNTDRNDYYLKGGVNCVNNSSISASITAQMEIDEHNRWLKKVASQGKKIGVITTTTTTTPTTKRFEAETYTKLADPGSNIIQKMQVANHSAGASVRLYDTGDKIRISFNVSTAGTYSVKARVRSGYYTSTSSRPTDYWPNYGFYLNGALVGFTGIASTVSAKDASYQGSYWGTMKSNSNLSLKAGTNTFDVVAKNSWAGIDYIEITPVTSSTARLADPEITESKAEIDIENNSAQFIAYPNPVQNVLNIEGSALKEKTTLSLYSSSGEPIVTNEEIASFDKKAAIDLQRYNLSKGLYFIKVQSGSKVFDKRIYKE